MKHFSCYVGQIAVQEDKERLNHTDIVCETSGKCRYKSQEDANQHSANSHHKEVSNSCKHVNGLDGFHLAKGLEQVVENLGGRKKTHWQDPPPGIPSVFLGTVNLPGLLRGTLLL